MRDFSVAIVGGGASGVLAALRLLRSDLARAGRLEVLLVESREGLGAGIAYSTDADDHFLNVATGRMGAFAEDPEGFLRWMEANHPMEKRAFVPRRFYRSYLEAELAAAVNAAPAGTFRRIRGRAVAWEYRTRGIRIEIEGGEAIVCQRIIAATGYREAEPPPVFRAFRNDPRFVADGWNVSATIPADARVLVLGNGLTAVDFLFRLARDGHRGPVLALSRKGLRPLEHLAAGRGNDERPRDFASWAPRGPRAALADFRRAVADLEDPAAWPLLVDRVRPEIHRIWAAWPPRERRRFLRHLRTFWDVHRHRIGAEAAREWEGLRARGFFASRAGRAVRAADAGGAIRVETLGPAGGKTEDFDFVVNCTGVVPDLAFLDPARMREDPLALGIETDECGRPFDHADRVLEGIYLLGPALRPRFWEMTAIPELRLQARVAVEAVLASFGA